MSEQLPPDNKEWVGEINSWRVVDNTLITYGLGGMAVRGQVLIGPFENVDGDGNFGGQAFFPPEACSYTPPGETGTKWHTSEGWRHGIWEKLEEFEILNHEQNGYTIEGDFDRIVWVTGRERPIKLSNLDIDGVMAVIGLATPRNQVIMDFMKDQMAARGANIWTTMTRKPDHPHLDELRAELKDLQTTASETFKDSDWVLDNLVFRGAKSSDS